MCVGVQCLRGDGANMKTSTRDLTWGSSSILSALRKKKTKTDTLIKQDVHVRTYTSNSGEVMLDGTTNR